MSNIFLAQAKADRFTELDNNRHALKPEEMKEYLGLLQENSKIAGERGDKIEAIKKQLGELKVSILELFTAEVFTEEAALEVMVDLQKKFSFSAPQLGFAPVAAKKARAASTTPRAAAAPRASDANPIVITIKPEGVGRSLTYHQGRVWETASDVVKKPWAKFPDSLLKAVKDGKLETFADEVWVKSKDGKLELEAIKWAANNPDKKVEENPHKPKAAAAAPAAAA